MFTSWPVQALLHPAPPTPPDVHTQPTAPAPSLHLLPDLAPPPTHLAPAHAARPCPSPTPHACSATRTPPSASTSALGLEAKRMAGYCRRARLACQIRAPRPRGADLPTPVAGKEVKGGRRGDGWRQGGWCVVLLVDSQSTPVLVRREGEGGREGGGMGRERANPHLHPVASGVAHNAPKQ